MRGCGCGVRAAAARHAGAPRSGLGGRHEGPRQGASLVAADSVRHRRGGCARVPDLPLTQRRHLNTGGTSARTRMGWHRPVTPTHHRGTTQGHCGRVQAAAGGVMFPPWNRASIFRLPDHQLCHGTESNGQMPVFGWFFLVDGGVTSPLLIQGRVFFPTLFFPVALHYKQAILHFLYV